MIRFLWDIFLYLNTPSFLPILSEAVSTATPFFAIYFFNFTFYTLIAVGLILLLSEKFALPTILSSKVGLAWGIIFTAEYSYYINVMEHFSVFINFIVLFIGIGICFTLLKASGTIANCLPINQDR